MITIDKQRFAANLIRLREESGLSAWRVAQALELGVTAYLRYERGLGLPSLDTLVGLCAVLICSPDHLLEGAVVMVGDGDFGLTKRQSADQTV